MGYGVYIIEMDGGKLAIDGLAYLAYAFHPLNIPASSPSNESVESLFKRVQEQHKKDGPCTNKSIKFDDRIQLLLEQECNILTLFNSFKIESIQDSTNVMDQLASLVINLYHSSDDFFILHGITSCYALKLVLSCLNLKDIPSVVHGYALALLVTYIIQNQPTLEITKARASNLSWDTICSRVLSYSDEHVIKLVWTCWKEYREYNNALYLLTAAEKTQSVSKLPTVMIGVGVGVAAVAIAAGLVYWKIKK